MKNTDDNELFYESIKYKYPRLLEETRAHICPDENIIINSIETENKMLKTMYIDTLGSESLLILAECDGSKSTFEIKKIANERYGISNQEFENNITLFNIYQNIFLEFNDEPVSFPNVVEITGTTEYFIPIYTVLEFDSEKIERMNTTRIIDALEIIYDKGCRIIEILGENVLTNKNSNEIFKYILYNFDLVIIRIDNFKPDRILVKDLEKCKNKVICVVDKEKGSDNLGLKNQIICTNLSKRGNSVRISRKGTQLELEDMNIKYVKDEFKDNRYNYDKIYIFSDERVEIKKINENGFEIGNLNDFTIEDILLNRYIKSNKSSQIVKNF
ncbi:MAG: hypothetical protein KIC98_06990 [Clostridioides difficile]|nr:hypothetical protein [Clostridioides sp.]MBS5787639.1 hypothetical protein [Clostridioides difficile]